MAKIADIEIITEEIDVTFEKYVKQAVNDMQDRGYIVEIQYSTIPVGMYNTSFQYSAMIIGKYKSQKSC